MTDSTESVRCLLVPLAGESMLLPNSVVAEVANWAEPEPFRTAPVWLHGEMSWNDWKVPVVSYSTLAQEGVDDRVGAGTRILILRTLKEGSTLPYIGVVIQGLPRIVTVTRDGLSNAGDGATEHVFKTVEVDEQLALIPDLDALSAAVGSAAYGDDEPTKH